jgi:ABC-2 type transport system ATP-binding protein
MSLSISNLHKSYGTQKALRNVSFELQPGTITGFLGPNGAGKTTTMKIIMGLIPADAGDVRVCGLDGDRQSLAVRRRVGYLPENNPLYGEMYIREFLRLSALLCGLAKRPLHDRIEYVMQACGLIPEQHKRIDQLSRGFRQRVGLAHALIHDPDVLILDEPTSGLDPNQLIEIRALIKKVSHSKTVLFSTHILQEAQALCNRIIIIRQGEVVADDTLSGLQERYGQTLEETFYRLTAVQAA